MSRGRHKRLPCDPQHSRSPSIALPYQNSKMPAEPQDHDVVAVIARSPWFEGLPDDAHQQLATAARVRSYRKGSYLFAAGETSTNVYCILSGRIRLLITSALGQEFAITDLHSEAWLGEQFIATDIRIALNALISEAATILLVPCNVLIEVGESHPRMYQKLFIETMQRSRGINRLISGMAFYPLKSRLAGWLLKLLDEHGHESAAGVTLDVNLSQNDLAQLSLGSRQRVNKILSEWRDQEIIELQGNRYLIRDKNALVAETRLKEPDK